MKAVMYRSFSATPKIQRLEDPTPENDGVVIELKASGICLSDWHGWQGNDDDISLPHVPGHELAGVVAAVGKGVTKWRSGDRVTVPFVGGCGSCLQCASGNHQREKPRQPHLTPSGDYDWAAGGLWWFFSIGQ